MPAQPRRFCRYPAQGARSISGSGLAIIVAILAAVVLLGSSVAEARRSKLKPVLTLKVRRGKKVIGTEELRIKRGQKDEETKDTKRYFSTKSRLNDGRRFGFRTHTVLNGKGKLLTYDRWIDVKGATLRRRVFAFKGAWKLVVFAQRGRKNDLTDLKHKGPLLVLDPRSPILVSMAVDRLVGKTELDFVDANTGKMGRLRMTAEHLVDTKGRRYIRYHLKGFLGAKRKAVALSVLRDDRGHTVQIVGLNGYSAGNMGLKLSARDDAPLPPPKTGAAVEGPAPAGKAAAVGTAAPAAVKAKTGSAAVKK